MASIDKIWIECLKLWDFAGCSNVNYPIKQVKDAWLKNNGYENIADECFFCEFASQNSKHLRNPDADSRDPHVQTSCVICPGRLIDKTFSCQDTGIHWAYNRLNFRDRLHELNAKRLKVIKCLT